MNVADLKGLETRKLEHPQYVSSNSRRPISFLRWNAAQVSASLGAI